MQLIRLFSHSGCPGPGRPTARRTRTLAAFGALSLLAVGCSAAATPSPQDNAPAHGRPAVAPAARALLTQAKLIERAQARRDAVAARWGLDEAPLEPPEPPAAKPRIATEPVFARGDGPDLPVALSRVPTDRKIVFLTLDDGYDKDPEFLRMAKELNVPYSAFLSDYLAKAGKGYGFFRTVQQQGNGVHNHTLHHPYLPGLSDAEQRKEICGQQENLTREMGRTPRLFRPPYGDYTHETLKIAASCGISVVPLWAEEFFPDRVDYSRGDGKLHPGDIILSHFRGRDDWRATMPDLLRNVLRTATEQGFAVARLEDYV
ncbi:MULTISPECIES: polysaccharide deacetylase family protein [Streptomyces]|uniref:Polysaccharide deacetylase family protein n=1 Tax=Streptomyces ramulosus TaxID=47762 RepID=A0ABW1FP73_9ACTN